jgi:hypothetical protein
MFMDIKKAPYELVYEQRMKNIDESLKSEHRGEVEPRDPELEIRPSRDSIQLGEGARK